MKVRVAVGLLLLVISPVGAGLTLDDVLRATAQTHPSILQAQQTILEAQNQLVAAEGEFDTALENVFNSTPEGGYENNYNATRLSMPVNNSPLTVYSEYRIGRGDWPSYYQNYLTNSKGEASIGLQLPLLKDFLIDKRRANLLISEEKIILAEVEAEYQRTVILREAGVSYWQWVLAQQRYQQTKALLDLANQRQQALLKREQLGDVPKIDVLENRRLILQRQEQLATQELKMQQAAQALSLYYRDPQGQPIVPASTSTGLPTISTTELVEDSLYTKISENSPVLRMINQFIAIGQTQVKLSKNELLPALNAELSSKKQYGKDGDPLLRQAAYNVGLSFNLPLQRRAAKSQYEIEKIKLFKLHLEKHLLEQKLAVDFRNVMYRINNDKRRVGLIAEELSLATQVEAAEYKRYKQGDSSIFLVNEREQTSFTLQIKYLDVVIDYQLAQLELNAICAFACPELFA